MTCSACDSSPALAGWGDKGSFPTEFFLSSWCMPLKKPSSLIKEDFGPWRPGSNTYTLAECKQKWWSHTLYVTVNITIYLRLHMGWEPKCTECQSGQNHEWQPPGWTERIFCVRPTARSQSEQESHVAPSGMRLWAALGSVHLLFLSDSYYTGSWLHYWCLLLRR